MLSLKKWYGLGALLFLILAAGAWYFFGRMSNEPVVLTIDPNATSTNIGGYTITRVDTPPGGVLPSLDRPITVSDGMSLEAKAVLKDLIEEVTAELKEQPDRVDLWLQLGLNRKIAGDDEGAIEVWNYVATGVPSSLSYIAHGNLGDIYMNVLKDYPKAEQNYLGALAIQPKAVAYYSELYTLYTYFYKTNTSAAKDILELGLKNNPGNPNLRTLLDAHIKN
jgi:tetratricopeptide (TPR) repeat protein